MGEAMTRYHISLAVADRPGVLAQVASAFADHDVSIETVRQRVLGEGDDSRASLVIVTHRAPDAALAATVDGARRTRHRRRGRLVDARGRSLTWHTSGAE